MERQYLKTRQVAELLGVSLNTIYRWLKKEKISEPLRGAENNYRLWTAEDIERILDKYALPSKFSHIVHDSDSESISSEGNKAADRESRKKRKARNQL